MRNRGNRFSAKILLICALGLPNAAHGLQAGRPPLQTKVAEPVARRIYLKLPLQHVRFHWRFMSREDLLSGKLVLRIKRGDLTNEIVIFENGAFAPGWEALEAGGPSQFYFGFRSTTTFLTAPDDDLEVELLVLKDLAGIGPLQTGVLAAGTYRAKGTYFLLLDDFDSSQQMSEAQLIDSLAEAGVTGDEAEMMARTVQGVYLAMRMNAFRFIAGTGCWENLWPLKITSNEGWLPPEQAALQERMLEIERARIEREGGPNCSGPT